MRRSVAKFSGSKMLPVEFDKRGVGFDFEIGRRCAVRENLPQGVADERIGGLIRAGVGANESPGRTA